MSLSVKRAALTTACFLMVGSVIAADLNPAGDIKAQAAALTVGEKRLTSSVSSSPITWSISSAS